jgi:hypothetical protein
MDATFELNGTVVHSIALYAHRDTAPTRERLVAAVRATGSFTVQEGAGRAALAEWYREPGQPDDGDDDPSDDTSDEVGADFGFRADAVDGALPVVVVYVPDRLFGAAERVGAFGFSPYDRSGGYSLGEVRVFIGGDDEAVARKAIATVAAFAEPLGLFVSDEDGYRDEDDSTCIPATTDRLQDSWRAWRGKLEDSRAQCDEDGSVRNDRVTGVRQDRRTVDVGDAELIAYDVTHDGSYVALARAGDTPVALVDGRTVAVPAGEWTGIAAAPTGGIVLFGLAHGRERPPGRHRGRCDVAFMDADGGVRAITTAPCGGVVVTDNHVVLTFCDEQVYGGDELMRHGLVAYDFDGNVALRYQDDVEGAVDIADCYAACHVRDDTIAFYAYDDFDLVLLDLATKQQVAHPTPTPRGHSAISIHDDVAYLHAPYHSDELYRWRIGSPTMESVGRFPRRQGLRGLRDGRFVSNGDSGYTIVTLP